MNIKDSVVLITGANRGLGKAWALAVLAAGARKVYAGARDPASIDIPGVVPIRLDITAPDQVAEAAKNCSDLTLLINNAGIARGGDLMGPEAADMARAELETNLFGTLAMSQAFAPVLAKNGGGAILNVLSVLSWITLPGAATYSISKAATWSMTNALRMSLRAQGTQVVGLHVGFMETEMTSGVDAPKEAPADVVRLALAAIEDGQEEVLADDLTRAVKKGLSDIRGVYLDAPA
ncbi:SDR family oxidoreductase [Massilia cavernae]|uniref:SDR family oxidoreductase n=1 Tax=Massilia cavernae TaxID=2320864 RepID=A0A418X6X8_9BURK|nr:SDR family oxidoreductase [Massilia cavernae]RJG08212.1 SDR family oxidoreductase [Massilia cavernae]